MENMRHFCATLYKTKAGTENSKDFPIADTLLPNCTTSHMMTLSAETIFVLRKVKLFDAEFKELSIRLQ